MNALDTINNIINNTYLPLADLKYCLVNKNKIPFKINGENAKPNNINDFVDIDTLLNCNNLEDYSGVGISIQASNISAIDVDKCFEIPFDINSADDRALDIIQRFFDYAYIEFSFSGKGLRVLFKQEIIENYSKTFYIKNESNGIEFYQPSQSYRYVTITGRVINNKEINTNKDFSHIILKFLNDYMKRPEKIKKEIIVIEEDNRSIEEIMKKVKSKLLIDYVFQEKWFSHAPGSNSNESEIDFYLLSYLYEHVVQDKEKLRIVFETSPYFKSKDKKHLSKWMRGNYQYYNYIYGRLG